MKLIILLTILFMFGCTTTQENAKDMLETLLDAECNIKTVSVKENKSYKITVEGCEV